MVDAQDKAVSGGERDSADDAYFAALIAGQKAFGTQKFTVMPAVQVQGTEKWVALSYLMNEDQSESTGTGYGLGIGSG